MLYAGETPGVKALEENMAAYFNTLQGFLLFSHGSLIGAGPTLTSCVHKIRKQVVDRSFVLLQEAVSSYGTLSFSPPTCPTRVPIFNNVMLYQYKKCLIKY